MRSGSTNTAPDSVRRLNAPAAVRRQLERLAGGLEDAIGADLTGIYLHGSLAMGCFNPRGSDLDLLVVTRTRIPATVWKRVAALLVNTCGRPAPLEISVVRASQIRPFRHPAPFDLCFSRDVLAWYRMILRSGRWKAEWRKVKRDADLAGHLTVTRARGVRLRGAPIRRAIPPVPRRFHLASILSDHVWGWRHAVNDPHGMGTYWVLNACRTSAYLESGRVMSKVEGARWAMRHLPVSTHGPIRRSLRAYRTVHHGDRMTVRELAAFGRAVETYSRRRCAFPGF